MRRLIPIALVVTVIGLLGTGIAAQVPGAAPAQTAASRERAARLQKERDNLELQRVAPFKVFDNLYYVGAGWVSAWLLTTDQGLILIDTLDQVNADHLLASIRKVGFDPKDIKYVLVTHAHDDHVGAVARIQENFGSRVAMMEGDWNLFNGVGGAKPEALAPRRDMVVKDGETLTLGKTTVRMFGHPGHTPGTLSLEFQVYDGGKPHRAYLFAGAAPGQGLQAVQQFVDSVGRIEKIADGVQARIVSHPWMDPLFWDKADRLAQRKPGDPHPFVIPGEFASWIAELKQVGTKRLAEAKAKAVPQN